MSEFVFLLFSIISFNASWPRSFGGINNYFPRFGIKIKRGVDFQNILKLVRKCGTECLSTRFALITKLYAVNLIIT